MPVSHLIPTATLQGKNYHVHFTDEETEAQQDWEKSPKNKRPKRGLESACKQLPIPQTGRQTDWELCPVCAPGPRLGIQ